MPPPADELEADFPEPHSAKSFYKNAARMAAIEADVSALDMQLSALSGNYVPADAAAPTAKFKHVGAA